MTASRPTFSAADELAFTTEVGGKCPLCGKPLFYRKGRKKHKGYEIAHIYPLNPKSAELEELKDEERLSSDPNDFENLIALCVECHTRFDKLNRPAFRRHLEAIDNGNDGGVYERQAAYG